MPNKKLGLIAILVSVAAGEIWAGTLSSYAVGDVLLCFRKSGGANGLVVDAGPISTFTNATLNQRIPITQYTGGQLAAALSATNGVSWSAFTWFDDSVNPNWTVCMTRARTVLNTQTAPWLAASAGSQQYLITTELATIPLGANDNFSVVLYNTNSTSTAVIEPDSSTGNTSGNYPDGQSYHSALDPTGFGDNNFGGFPGNPENTTTNNFTTAGKVARSDFYWIPPTGSGAVKYLGYFELNTNGVMTFVAKPIAIPTLKSISRSGNIATLTYKSGVYGTYTLLGTNKLSSASFSTWPAVGGALSAGDNLTHTVQDTDSVSNKFYIIQAQ
jgi:hypothetical protein